jgi:hypothetical protein
MALQAARLGGEVLEASFPFEGADAGVGRPPQYVTSVVRFLKGSVAFD